MQSAARRGLWVTRQISKRAAGAAKATVGAEATIKQGTKLNLGSADCNVYDGNIERKLRGWVPPSSTPSKQSG